MLTDTARRVRIRAVSAVSGRRGAAAPWQLLWGKAVRRIGWGIADQAVSTLTNFAVSIYVARALGAEQFGAFGVAYVTYAFALNASRGLASSPMVIRFSGTDDRRWRRATASCTGTATLVGLLSGAFVLGATPLLGGAVRPAILALGLTLPGLLLQDSWRFSFFAAGRGGHAFLNDLIWGLTLIPAVALLARTGHASVFWFVLAWGATAGIGAAVGPLQARVAPRMSDGWNWLRTHRDLGPRYLAEGLSSAGASQARTYGIGLILSLTAVGYIQAVTTEMGPVTVLYAAIGLVAIPEASRVVRRSPRRLSLFCVLVSVAMVVAALGWGLVLLIALPAGLGKLLLGHIWRPAYPLLVPQILWVTAGGASGGAGAGIHALGGVRRALRVMVISSVLCVVLTLLGALAGGARWALIGAALSAWIIVPLMWQQLHAAKREYDNALAGGQDAVGGRNGKHRKSTLIPLYGFENGTENDIGTAMPDAAAFPESGKT
jgi:O-antigen/teichoic acid export membrane protein